MLLLLLLLLLSSSSSSCLFSLGSPLSCLPSTSTFFVSRFLRSVIHPRTATPSIYPQLFIAIIGYASVGTFVTTRLGGKLVGLNFEQLQTEADFRWLI